MTDVYFWKIGDTNKITDEIFKIAKEKFNSEKIGIKIHFGEEKNTTHLDAKMFDCVKDHFDEPYYVETNVLYRGRRTFRDEHIKLAKEHGFTNIPIKILDGDHGEETLLVPVNKNHVKDAKIGKGIDEFENLISMAHYKGHIKAGVGGAIKNISMGCAARGGKLEMHSSDIPVVYEDACTACGLCAEGCDFSAIKIGEYAVIDKEKCSGCSMCIAVCPSSAIGINWGDSSPKVIERMAEYALAVTKGRKWLYANYLINMTKECDCMGITQKPFIKDIGVLLSDDPVAIDQASIDLVKKTEGKDPFKANNNIDSEHLLEYAEKIGLGSRKYNFVYL